MFTPFDPLKAKSIANTEVAAAAMKREIQNILQSYVGWFDPFAELVQNALDAVDEQARNTPEGTAYDPTVWVTIDLKEDRLTVTDNGTGLTKQKFEQFLAPDVSFKSGNTRGHKGVGATYLAYGFNYMQIATRCADYGVRGKIVDARKWLQDPTPAGNPEVKPDTDPAWDPAFGSLKHGTSITVKFDQNTHPKDLAWQKAFTAETWHKLLSVKTGIGAFHRNPKITVCVTVFDKEGKKTELTKKGIEYLWPHELAPKAASYVEIQKKTEELFKKHGTDFTMPPSLMNLDMLYDIFDAPMLEQLVTLDEGEKEILNRFTPTLYFGYAYSATFWTAFNEGLGIRSNSKVLSGGIQIAANNMPQGDLVPILLNKNVGIQYQVHVLIHFENCSADLGRKGFQAEIVEFAKEVSKRLLQGPLTKYRKHLRPVSGAAPDIRREHEVDKWKDLMAEYEKSNPLAIKSEVFFLPTKKISITSAPTREQDVIALFNQMLAGGIIRGVRIMSTNERFIYDSLFKILLEEPTINHLYHPDTNPLGINQSVLDAFKGALPFASKPKVLEYKYSLDGLMEDLDTEEKNAKDIGLVVVWETGKRYAEHYQITSLLDPGNLGQRQYHGLSHIMNNLSNNSYAMDLIVLSELVDSLNDPKGTAVKQRAKYEQQ